MCIANSAGFERTVGKERDRVPGNAVDRLFLCREQPVMGINDAALNAAILMELDGSRGALHGVCSRAEQGGHQRDECHLPPPGSALHVAAMVHALNLCE